MVNWSSIHLFKIQDFSKGGVSFCPIPEHYLWPINNLLYFIVSIVNELSITKTSSPQYIEDIICYLFLLVWIFGIFGILQGFQMNIPSCCHGGFFNLRYSLNPNNPKIFWATSHPQILYILKASINHWQK